LTESSTQVPEPKLPEFELSETDAAELLPAATSAAGQPAAPAGGQPAAPAASQPAAPAGGQPSAVPIPVPATATSSQPSSPSAIAAAPKLSNKELLRCMQNRELSWLRFNERVLDEASSQDTPLFERLFFLSVFTSNLDEFFMVRVGSFDDIARFGTKYIDGKTGWGAAELLERIYQSVVPLYHNRDVAYARVEAELARAGMARRLPGELSVEDEAALGKYYRKMVEPLLAPQIIDKTHPFPHLENKRLFVALRLETKGSKMLYGLIALPNDVERIYFTDDGGYLLLEDIILHYCGSIFKRYKIDERAVICVTRNADIDTINENFDTDEDFMDYMTKLLKRRKRLHPVRLEVQGSDLRKLPEYFRKRLSLSARQVFTSKAPLDLGYSGILRNNTDEEQRKQLSYPAFEPVVPQNLLAGSSADGTTVGMIEHLRQSDVLLMHPFESIQPLLSLIKEASEDHDVVSIQITLYRVADHSRLAEYLIAAAENGKQVVVFIELRARMDEENNIGWAKRLEESGCRVFYGQLDYKMHAKIMLITRRGNRHNEYFVHIGTGNYNEKTVRLYTDISLLTTNSAITDDAIRFFRNMLVAEVDDSYPTLLVAPRDFRRRLLELIAREGARGSDGVITIKCNSITDKGVIEALVRASMAGAHINLIIRGICCLVPGVKGYTDNIHIRSIVGRFLEHSRIYRFGTGEDCDLYMGSGDMMTRNTTRRVELFTPVFDPQLRARVLALLDTELNDSVKARMLTSSGHYIPCPPSDPPIDSQQFLMRQAQKELEKTVETTIVATRPATGPVGRLKALLVRMLRGRSGR
jgi:polyphosphate kinase